MEHNIGRRWWTISALGWNNVLIDTSFKLHVIAFLVNKLYLKVVDFWWLAFKKALYKIIEDKEKLCKYLRFSTYCCQSYCIIYAHYSHIMAIGTRIHWRKGILPWQFLLSHLSFFYYLDHCIKHIIWYHLNTIENTKT